VTETAAAFGYSRPSYYEAAAALAAAGLEGLVAAKPGPHGGHKLTEAVLAWAEEYLAGHPGLRPAGLVDPIEDQFGVHVHPRSIERALARRRERSKRSLSSPPCKNRSFRLVDVGQYVGLMRLG
jgi:transposase